MALAHGRGDVAVAVDDLGDPEAAQIVPVLGQPGGDHGGPGADGQLHREATHPAAGPDHQHGGALAQAQGVVGGQGGEAGQGRRPGLAHVDAGRLAGHRKVLGHHDQLRPGALMHGGVGMQQEPEHGIPGGMAVDRGAGLLDHAGVVAAQHHRELVVDHAPEDAAGDEGVDRVDRGGPDADQQLVVADLGGG